ncbi:flagellar export protein FliJ [Erwinia oleae]|uniref:flagellar export protein FliJ n=1 Tax=Erwinia oleae TaxID=796334 RepID=UPI00055981E0|nr:flagellar export protein FliJ [Erwinia oleae]
MQKDVRTLGVLEQLRQMRERALDEAAGRLSQQKILCQRYSQNIHALTRLSDGSSRPTCDALQMSNQAKFKATVQRVIDWQKQEQALAMIEQESLQRAVVEEACRERTLNIVLERQRAALRQVLQKQEQKQTDAQAMQSWLRRRGGSFSK